MHSLVNLRKVTVGEKKEGHRPVRVTLTRYEPIFESALGNTRPEFSRAPRNAAKAIHGKQAH